MTTRYRGRIAPSPTGYLHAGHLATFRTAWQRAQDQNGNLILRIEDLDPQRCKPEFTEAAIRDLQSAGLTWTEGPDIGGPHPPYFQSQCTDYYREIFETLKSAGHIYPCDCSRKEINSIAGAPHGADDEIIYPGTCRSRRVSEDTEVAWRFRVPDGEAITFTDKSCGPQSFVAGKNFGDFALWRKDGVPAYHLAVVADDHRMGITEIVRGADLLVSTARHLLLYRALNWPPPAYYHCPLILDEQGNRLAKRNQSQPPS